MECDAPDLVIEGEVPADLAGTFSGMDLTHSLRREADTTGLLAMACSTHFILKNGRIGYKNRWARTKKFELERAAGRALFSAFNPMDADPSVVGMETDGLANTNIVWHGGRLLALEEGHAPFEFDPDSLASKGAWDFGAG